MGYSYIWVIVIYESHFVEKLKENSLDFLLQLKHLLTTEKNFSKRENKGNIIEDEDRKEGIQFT